VTNKSRNCGGGLSVRHAGALMVFRERMIGLRFGSVDKSKRAEVSPGPRIALSVSSPYGAENLRVAFRVTIQERGHYLDPDLVTNSLLNLHRGGEVVESVEDEVLQHSVTSSESETSFCNLEMSLRALRNSGQPDRQVDQATADSRISFNSASKTPPPPPPGDNFSNPTAVDTCLMRPKSPTLAVRTPSR